MTPEATLMVVNGAFIAFAYGLAYPAMEPKTLMRLARADIAITGAVLIVGGLLFAGAGIGFSLIAVDVPWWLFAIVTKSLMELPLFLRFKRRHGLSFDPGE